MPARWRFLSLVAAPIAWFGASVSVPDPVVTAVAPATVLPGQNITVSGTNLLRTGFTAELQFTKKYLAAGEAPSGVVVAGSQSATQLVFPAPANARPTGFALRYKSNATGVALSAVTAADTGFASRAPFAIPGRVDVLEAPIVLTGNQGVVSQSASGQVAGLQLLLPGAMELHGRNLLPPPGASASVTFNGVAVPQSGAPRYDATANTSGADIIPLQVAEPSVSTAGTMTVTTPGGTGSNTNFLILRRPRIVGVDELNSLGAVVGTSGGRLVRGVRYQIRGSDLAFPAAPPFALSAHVLLGATPANSVVTVDAGHVQFTVPTTLTATNVELLVNTAAGFAGSAGILSVTDPGARPPPLADVTISPSTTTWGTTLSATIAFAGSILSGANIGNVVISSPTPDDFVGLPLTVAITSNPQTVTIPTRVRALAGTRTLRVRLARLTDGVDSLDRQVQLAAPSLTAIALAKSSVGGGEIVPATLSFDFPAGVTPSCGIAPATPPDLRVDVAVSDSSVANVANRLGDAAGMCVSGNPTQIPIQARIVSSARTVQITARLGQSTRSATLTVLPPTLSSVTIDRPSLVSMQTAVGTIVMNSPMPAATVLLSSSDPAIAVPAKISLGAGLTTTFAITTLPVATHRTVTISAAVNGVTQSATITLDPLQFTSVTLSPSAVRAGTTIAGTIALNATIDLPFTATLSTSDSSAVTLPSTVTFAARQSATAFNVQTRTPRPQSKAVTIGVTYTVALPNGTTVITKQNAVLTVSP